MQPMTASEVLDRLYADRPAFYYCTEDMAQRAK